MRAVKAISAGALGLLFFVLANTASEGASCLWLQSRIGADSTDYWRLWTHIFVHESYAHLVLNLAGLVALCLLWPQLQGRPFFWLSLWAMYGVTAAWSGAWHGSEAAVVGPSYGLSGLLHGVFAYATLCWPFSRVNAHLQRIILGAGLLVKLSAEALSWVPVEGVAWQLHITGAGAGAVLALLSQGRKVALARERGVGDQP